MALSRPRRWTYWLAGGIVTVVALAVGGTFLYIHVIQGPPPPPLSLKSGSASAGPASASAAASTGASSAVAGTWQVGSGSRAGYRVKEVLLGQNNIAVGRTSHVTGTLAISGTKVTVGTFTVQVAAITSDQSQRDAQFRGRIMDTARYPTAVLKLTAPIQLAPVPATGTVRTYHAVGALTLHGTTRTVRFALSAERTTSGLAVSGMIPVAFAQYHVPNPSFGSFVTTASKGQLEFLLRFTRS